MPQSFVYHAAAKILVYQTDHSAVLYRTAQYLYEFAVIHCIVLGDLYPTDGIRTVCTVKKGAYQFILVSLEPWKQLLT